MLLLSDGIYASQYKHPIDVALHYKYPRHNYDWEGKLFSNVAEFMYILY